MQRHPAKTHRFRTAVLSTVMLIFCAISLGVGHILAFQAEDVAVPISPIAQNFSPAEKAARNTEDKGDEDCMVASIAMVLQWAKADIPSSYNHEYYKYARHEVRATLPATKGLTIDQGKSYLTQLSAGSILATTTAWGNQIPSNYQLSLSPADMKDFPSSGWKEFLNKELKSGNPVIVTIADPTKLITSLLDSLQLDLHGSNPVSGGHEIVVTGLRGDMVLFNNPWSDKPQQLAASKFAEAWGSGAPGNRWQAITIRPASATQSPPSTSDPPSNQSGPQGGSGSGTTAGARITPQVVWHPSENALRQITQCNMGGQGDQANQSCVLPVMRSNGASDEAVAFAASQSGKLYAHEFTSAGKVAVVAVACTLPTNFNCGYSYLIVNGNPSPIQADWQQSTDLDGPLNSDLQYKATLAAHPSSQFLTMRWLGEDIYDQVQPISGGTALLFWSPIKESHASEPIGRIYVAYNFDANAKYLGRNLDHVSGTSTSPQASIKTDKQQYRDGETVHICYTVPGPGPITITDYSSGGGQTQLAAGPDDGTGDCVDVIARGPASTERLVLDYTAGGRKVSVETRYEVMTPGLSVGCPPNQFHIEISPTSGPPGTAVTLTGCGMHTAFPNAPSGQSLQLRVSFGFPCGGGSCGAPPPGQAPLPSCNNSPVTVGEVLVDKSGTLSAVFKVPAGFQAGTCPFLVSDGAGARESPAFTVISSSSSAGSSSPSPPDSYHAPSIVGGWPQLDTGTQGEAVKSLQYLLQARRISVTIDGQFGPQTDAAVRAFQKAGGLTVDGIVGPITWQALIVPTQQGSQGSAVRAIQSLLAARGLPTMVDGDFGPQTAATVRTYQQRRRLTVDGRVGPQTWQALLNDLDAR